MREPTTSSEETAPEIADDENLTNGEVVSSDVSSEEKQPEQEQPEEKQPEDEQSEEEMPTVELPDVEPLVVDRPRARLLPADNASGSYQRRIPIRYGISGNSTRGSRNLPEPKHLTIKLPDAVSHFFAGVWVAVKGDEVFLDFFARNDQNDRTGHAPSDPWRWIKIKDSGEIAMAISRPYTKSRTDGELVRDYRIGAFKLAVPLGDPSTGMIEPSMEQQP
jgi:hypothetical protein